MDSTHAQPKMVQKRKPMHRVSWVLAVLVGAWFLLMRQFGGADVYSVLGPYASSVIFVLWLLRPHALRRWFTPTAKTVFIGVVVGAVMTLATYPVFDLASRLLPGLESYVEQLYGSASTASLWGALLWVTVIIFAEEVLFRGFLLEDLERRLPKHIAWPVSVLVYALAQLGSGSWVVCVMAVVCGTIWALERRWTRSLVAPLISHLIWTPTVIVLYPVT